mmetsp:Transcript_34454/g.51944  ORF Transcript_34454/g.51944 Transcript_34454/m.51944 type:complete len:236 (-) Transcript_34454:66-773(-)|eukprot:CAMPEP_0206480322 /NCGR_PEP_ID=MMETSP0324_2-20121206/37215_1 /ASSEMBLY_ACC=CAM_ASM_000836 /TAXON_ID=2866 /ORGANISM="Crypthecodinium cohnii, Strain Seligo" /LENGTH=235 /DNA_ID=CAMNT_0053957067 /DNA_START=169 /DNA_END=876 /DNA_ORIENTATION=-
MQTLLRFRVPATACRAAQQIRPSARSFAPLAGRRCFSDSSFDVFAKQKDPPGEAGKNELKRKPSDKVLRLVDEIMSLTLVEAADLCDLCQEKLAPGSGPAPGRMPFPHPMGMFPGMGMPAMPGAMPMPGAAPAAAPAAAPDAAPAEDAGAGDAAPAEEKKKETKKDAYSIKLVSFETSKKINVVKEVRAVTQLGLKESKEFVEGAPKIIKKGVPAAEAEAIKEKLTAAGAEVVLE